MELKDLGFNGWFQEQRKQLHSLDCSIARITRVDRDRYRVRNEQGEVEAEATGNLIYNVSASEELPCVGDWVHVRYYNEDTLAIIHEVFPRQSFLRRKSAGKGVQYQMIASNIDTACIMQSSDGDFNVRRLERYLAMAYEGHVEPLILLSKSDLVSPGILENRIAAFGDAHIRAKVIPFSNVTGIGLGDIREVLTSGRTSCLLGSSGVGKTTLLNHLLGHDQFETAPVRESDGKGRHATARRQLTVLGNGALLIDTPGMRELGLIGADSGIDESFSEIAGLSKACRFNDCTHTVEAGCAIALAVREGTLSAESYLSYLKLKKESEFHRLSYAERRKKDKQFGRMVKSAMKLIAKK